MTIHRPCLGNLPKDLNKADQAFPGIPNNSYSGKYIKKYYLSNSKENAHCGVPLQ